MTGSARPGGARPSPWPTTAPSAEHRRAFADAERSAFWLDRLPPRQPEAALSGSTEAELCIVGGGFTGLWAALHAKRDDPARDVVLLESETIGYGASGRNGGFCSASITHGLENGLSRFADEMPVLERLARENLSGLVADLARLGIECDLTRSGELTPSLAPHQDAWLEEAAALHERWGYDVELLPDAAAVRGLVNSPLYRSGVWIKDGGGVLDPAKLAVGLLAAARRAGVRVHERTPATTLSERPGGVRIGTVGGGGVDARRVLLATSAFPPLLRRLRRYIVPVYDYVLMSEPLSSAQKASVGWDGRQGVGDAGNRFHYYRLSDDDRILWGGYEAVYRFGGPVRESLDDDEPTFATLSQNFFTTFPQLEGLRFTHRWGGAIDTCSRFSVFFGTALSGRAAYAIGYTGLGVGASRFGARVALDLVDGKRTEATATRYVRTKPVPFPPEPLRSAVVQLTRNRLAAADRREGRRGVWLGTLDRLGLGFDS